jgi:hypothetical protein
MAGAFDVRKFGATGDGKTLDSDAVNRAIDAASFGTTPAFGFFLRHVRYLEMSHVEVASAAADAPCFLSQGCRAGGFFLPSPRPKAPSHCTE